MIVDPFDSNVAVLDDGKVGYAVRFLPAGTLPSSAAWAAAPVMGYGYIGALDDAEED